MAEKNGNGLDKKFGKSKKAVAFLLCTLVLGGLAGLAIALDRDWTASVVMVCAITIGVVCAVLILGQAAVDRIFGRAAGLLPGKILRPYNLDIASVERTYDPAVASSDADAESDQ